MGMNKVCRFRLACVLAVSLYGAFAWGNDSSNHVDEALTIDVPSGETVEYSGVISGTSSITKSGAGTLVLSNPANSFTGGISIQRGCVKATAAGALGADSGVIAFSGDQKRQLIIEVDAEAEFKNPVTFTGKASDAIDPAIVILGGPVTLSGSITSDTDFFVYYGLSADDMSTSRNVTLGGAITLTAGTLGIGSWATFDLKGKLDVPVVYVSPHGYNQYQSVQIWNGGNKIGKIYTRSSPIVAKADQAFGGAQIYLEQNWENAARGFYNLNGKKMNVKSFDYRREMGSQYLPKNVSDRGSLFISYAATTVTVTGDEGEFVCLHKFQGPFDLLIDATSFGDSFVQKFEDRRHELSGDIMVSNGVMRVCTTSAFPAVQQVTVGPNGSLFIDTTGGTAFSGCTKLVLDGKFTVSEGATKPFADGTLELELGAGAELTLPADMRLRVASLTVNGEPCTGGVSDSSSLDQIKGGVIVLPSPSEVAWTAGGGDANESIMEKANWGGTLPDLLYGSTKAFFASAGSNADVGCGVRLSAMRVKAPVDGAGFSFSKSADDAFIELGGNATFENDATDGSVTNRYVFGVPVKLDSDSVWSVPGSDTVLLTNGVHSADSAYGRVKEGAGTLVVSGESDLAGALEFKSGTIRLAGDIGPAGNGDNANAVRLVSGEAPVWFDGGEIAKDVYIDASGYSNFRFLGGSTTVFKGFVWTVRARNFFFESGATVVFEGGFNVRGKMNLCGFTANDARVSVIIRNAPWSTTEYLCVGYTGNFDLDTTIESQGSCPQIFVRQRATLNFGVSYANTNSAARLDLTGVTSYPAGGTINLNDTTQSFCRVYGSLGKITGGYPSCIVINDPEGNTANLSAKVEGGAGFLKRGAGTFTLTGRDFTSCGDIAVESGVLEIASDATWRNGTNVFVSGSGTLRLGGANRFNGSFVQFNLGEDEDGWMIDIPSGCAQTVDYAWDADGNRLPCGVYGASGVQGVNRNRYASHFPANGGVLRVKAHGTVVSLR